VRGCVPFIRCFAQKVKKKMKGAFPRDAPPRPRNTPAL
jgi:hypothetical protein